VVAGSRREARERALALLYECYAKGLTVEAVVDDLVMPPDPFAESLVRGVGTRESELDQLIQKFARGWTIDRMPVLDRTILRMAIYELVADAATPVGVVISEAVELAKLYSTEESGKFINGVLASVAAEVRQAL
jgi:N utilization substance protein B